MTNIKYKHHDNEYSIVLKGHAESGPTGKDLACAGLSVLSYTLAQGLRDLKAEGQLIKFEYILKSGYTEIKCKSDSFKVPYLFDVVINGYMMLKEAYPNNIEFNILPLY